jgi:hypothetical protein
MQSDKPLFDVMLDIETMGVGPNAAVASIGAVKFNPRGAIGVLGNPQEENYQHFHRTVLLQSLSDSEFQFDGATVAFWLEQNDEARAALLADAQPLDTVLSAFWDWYGPTSVPTWGNGAGFDNVILRNAYTKLAGVCPFKFYHDRCFRTMKALFPDVQYVKPTLAHHALQDAEAQAIHLQKLFNRINFSG